MLCYEETVHPYRAADTGKKKAVGYLMSPGGELSLSELRSDSISFLCYFCSLHVVRLSLNIKFVLQITF